MCPSSDCPGQLCLGGTKREASLVKNEIELKRKSEHPARLSSAQVGAGKVVGALAEQAEYNLLGVVQLGLLFS